MLKNNQVQIPLVAVESGERSSKLSGVRTVK